MIAQGSIFISFWMTFGIPFSINFSDPLNVLICNSYNAKTSFLPLQASHFGIRNQSTNHVFSDPFLGPPFSRFFQVCSKNGRPRDPLDIQWAPKWHPKTPQWRQNAENKHKMVRFVDAPAFHETTIITMPLGPSGFQKVKFKR